MPAEPPRESCLTEAHGWRVGDACTVIKGTAFGCDGQVRAVVKVGNTTWMGVELREPMGMNDGSTKNGARHFRCEPDFGIYLRPNALRHRTMEEALHDDLERVRSDCSDLSLNLDFEPDEETGISLALPPIAAWGDTIRVVLLTDVKDSREVTMHVDPSTKVMQQVRWELRLDEYQLAKVAFGEQEIIEGTFREYGIEDGAKLFVTVTSEKEEGRAFREISAQSICQQLGISDVNEQCTRNRISTTALHIAVQQRKFGWVSMLLEAGAVPVPDGDGHYPDHYCAANSDTWTVNQRELAAQILFNSRRA